MKATLRMPDGNTKVIAGEIHAVQDAVDWHVASGATVEAMQFRLPDFVDAAAKTLDEAVMADCGKHGG